MFTTNSTKPSCRAWQISKIYIKIDLHIWFFSRPFKFRQSRQGGSHVLIKRARAVRNKCAVFYSDSTAYGIHLRRTSLFSQNPCSEKCKYPACLQKAAPFRCLPHARAWIPHTFQLATGEEDRSGLAHTYNVHKLTKIFHNHVYSARHWYVNTKQIKWRAWVEILASW